MKRIIYFFAAVVFIGLISLNPVFAAHVELNKARTVAENWLHHQVWAFSDWIDVDSKYPYIEEVELVHYEGQLVAYNFLVNPQGHILVPARDELPPVKLYSASRTQTFDQGKALPYFLEAVLLELYQVAEVVTDVASAPDIGDKMDRGALDYSENTRLWSLFDANTQDFVHAVQDASSEQKDMLSISPLVSTTWAQGSPYNFQTPKWFDGQRTLVGCVATAAAQIMKYHEWPKTGNSSSSYKWWNGKQNITLSRNFSNSRYSWTNMPKKVTSASSSAQKTAVAKLSGDVGIAFKMNFGPDGSSAYTSDVTTVLPNYFRYKTSIRWVERKNYSSDVSWMKVFRKEFQNQRPAILAIAENNNGERKNGHAVVVSGYRDAPSEQIHINMGWDGSYNGWYASNNIKTSSYTFNWFNQGAGIGIEPKVTGAQWTEYFRKIPSNWRQDSGVWKIAGNEFWQTSGRAGKWNASTHKGNFSNVDYSAKVKRTGSVTHSNNILVRAGGPILADGLPQNLYCFQYSRDGHFSVFKRINGQWTALKKWTASTHIKKSTNWNTLRAVANGNKLSFYINGKRVWSGSDSILASGWVGVSMYRDTISKNNSFLVDWAKLKEL